MRRCKQTPSPSGEYHHDRNGAEQCQTGVENQFGAIIDRFCKVAKKYTHGYSIRKILKIACGPMPRITGLPIEVSDRYAGKGFFLFAKVDQFRLGAVWNLVGLGAKGAE